MKETIIQFGGPPASATACPVCGQHFSSGARFCPFDGEALCAAPDWDPTGDPLLGKLVDERFEIEEVLGEGGMGTVYGARHVSLGRRFALKALRRDLTTDPDLAQRFIQEARAAARVAHPNVVQITDFGTLATGEPYFVMELLSGRSLRQVIREDGPLSPARVLPIARQIAEALAAAHGAGVIHRDLKPDNVQLTDRDAVKVLDFGLAKVAGTSRFTRAGVVFGTPHYMSPEQAAGEPSDHRIDVYALGILIYEMLTGRVPFESETFMGVLTKHIYMAPERPATVLSSGDDLAGLDGLVMRCLEKKPDARFATMEEVLAALDALGGAQGASRVQSGAPTSDAGSRRDHGGVSVDALPLHERRVWPLVVAAAAVLVIAVGVAWRLARTAGADTSVPSGAAAVAQSSAVAPVASAHEAPKAPAASAQEEPRDDAPSSAASAAHPPRARAGIVPGGSDRPATTSRKPRPQPSTPGGSDIVNPWE